MHKYTKTDCPGKKIGPMADLSRQCHTVGPSASKFDHAKLHSPAHYVSNKTCHLPGHVYQGMSTRACLPGHVRAIVQHILAIVLGCETKRELHHLTNSFLRRPCGVAHAICGCLHILSHVCVDKARM